LHRLHRFWRVSIFFSPLPHFSPPFWGLVEKSMQSMQTVPF
jgi:hypothetical protein